MVSVLKVCSDSIVFPDYDNSSLISKNIEEVLESQVIINSVCLGLK